jgi:hypothetical protein
MTIGGFIILFVIVTAAALTFIEIGGMPGREARSRHRPNAEAISILGWLGLPLGGVGWLIAMVWARSTPLRMEVVDAAKADGVEDDA